MYKVLEYRTKAVHIRSKIILWIPKKLLFGDAIGKTASIYIEVAVVYWVVCWLIRRKAILYLFSELLPEIC